MVCVVILATGCTFYALASFSFGWVWPGDVFEHLARLRSFGNRYWLLLTLATIPTAHLWLRDRRTVKPGCCPVCGYDLRASKKTCPECGTLIAVEPPKTAHTDAT